MKHNANKNNQEKYQKLLNDLIPHLDEYSYLSGTEGKVYFVHDLYVVKEYYNSDINVSLFNKYCEEIQSFADRGFSVPKIYAWACVFEGLYNKNSYILEERIKGNNLFREMKDMYPKVQHQCSEEEFHEAIFKPKKNAKLFTEILIAYLTDINDTAKSLLNLEEDKLQDFINSLYHLYTDSNNSFPDIHENNILFDGNQLTIIDQLALRKDPNFSLEQARKRVIGDIFGIFEKFSVIQSVQPFHIGLKPKFQSIKNETLQNAISVVKRFGKQCQKILPPNPKLTFDDFYFEATSLFDDKLSKKLAEEIEKE